MEISGKKLPGLGNQRGAALLLIVLIGLSIATIFSIIFAIKMSRENKEREVAARRGITVKCKKAIGEIKVAMDAEKKLTGQYPYSLDGDFLDRYKAIDRYIYNKEIWSPHMDNTVELETAFGDSYILTGYCRDGYIYIFDSIDNKLYTKKFVLKYQSGDES